jgi:hypothetical protein
VELPDGKSVEVEVAVTVVVVPVGPLVVVVVAVVVVEPAETIMSLEEKINCQVIKKCLYIF